MNSASLELQSMFDGKHLLAALDVRADDSQENTEEEVVGLNETRDQCRCSSARRCFLLLFIYLFFF